MDWDISSEDALTALGDLYDGKSSHPMERPAGPPPAPFVRHASEHDIHGANVLLRWQHKTSEESDITLQAYFDNAYRRTSGPEWSINTYDLDLQHRFPLGARQEITWGLGYRLISDDIKGGNAISYDVSERNLQLFSTFLQNQITITENLWLTLGSKFEHNDYTGFEVQPSARVLWHPRPRHTVWGAVSRAVRTPSRKENDFRADLPGPPPEDGPPPPGPGPGPGPVPYALLGNDDMDSEDLIAYELGYRHQFTPGLTVDVTGFYNTYDNLRSEELGETGPPDPLVYRQFDNLMHGETYGIEMASDWQAMRRWRLSSSYTWLKMNLHMDSSSNDFRTEDIEEGSSPEHQFQVRSYLNLPYNLEQDTALYYVSRLHETDIPSYTRLDMRLGWHPRDDLELSLSAQNLLEHQHMEFEKRPAIGNIISRSIYAKITWTF